MAIAFVVFVLPAASFAGYREDVLGDGAVGYWRLGESAGLVAADERGTSSGAYAGSVDLGRAGVSSGNTAARFDLGGHMRVPDAPALNPAGAITLETWFRPSYGTDYGAYKPLLLKSFTSHVEPYYQYGLFMYDNGAGDKRIRVVLANSGQFTPVDFPASFGYRSWHHLAATWDGSVIKAYLDGVEIGSAARTGSIPAYPTPVDVGCYENLPQDARYCSAASFDEAAVYPTALSAARIQAHFQAGTPPPPPGHSGYALTVLSDTPWGYWKLNDEGGGAAADSSGNGRDLAASPRGWYTPMLWERPGIAPELAPQETSLEMRGNPSSYEPGDRVGRDLDLSPGHSALFVDNFTAEAWVKPTLEGYMFLIGYGNPIRYGSSGWGLLTTDQNALTLFVNGSLLITGSSLPVGEWTHVAVRRSNGVWTIYRNGVAELGSGTVPPLEASDLYFGADGFGGGGLNLKGFIAHGAAYDRALPAQRIWAHYQAGVTPQQPLRQTYGTLNGSGTHARAPSKAVSDPVNTLTGAFTYQARDLDLPGTGVPFALVRTYTSVDGTIGRFGRGWWDSYSVALTVQGSGDVLLKGDEGQEILYTLRPDGTFLGGAGSLSTLAAVTGGYELTRPDQTVYKFDQQGRLTSIKDRNQQGVTLAYDGSGLLATATDSVGRAATFSYAVGAQPTSVSVGGRSVSYGYTNGLLTSFTDVRGKLWSYAYDAGGRLTTIIDPLNHTQVSNAYDLATGRVTSQTDALNKTTTFAWDAATQTATITDPNGKVWKDVYRNNVLQKEIDPLLNTTQYVHDGDLNPTQVSGPDGAASTMSYDAAGNLLTAAAPASLGSAQKTFTYNDNNDPAQVTDARGKVTAYGYDAAGNNTTVAQDGTTVGTYTYDTVGRVLTFTDGNSKTTTFTYDANGRTASETNHLGEKTTFTHDAAGNVLTRTLPKGNCAGCTPADYTWTYTYNQAGQLLTETNPLGHVTTRTYDDAGRLATLTDANVKATTYAYDNANRLLSATAPDTGVMSYTYDDAGNVLTETNSLNSSTTYTYDSANRKSSETKPSGAKTTFFYDANGNLVKQVEPRGNVGGGVNPDDYATTYTYDAAGRLLTETDPLGEVTTHVYDAVGNEISVTDGNNKATTYTYDGKNRLATVTAPDAGISTYTYDAVGNKLTEKDPRNNTTTYTYDGANRIASVTKPSGGKSTYGYDLNGNQTSLVEPRGNVTGCGCASQYAWTYAFDRADRKLSEADPLGNTTTFAYDSVGNRLSVTDANTRVTAYTYDAVNRLKTVTAPDLGVTTYTYDLVGNLTQRKDARNNTTTFAYDVDNRRTSVTNPLNKLWSTTYDPAGNVTTTVDPNGNATPAPGDGTTTYAYNRAGRLTNIDYSDSTPDASFTYDAVGNRLSMLDGSGTQSRTYDSVNRLLTVVRGADSFSYQYDLTGNLTRRTYPGSVATDYTYDVDNRLATAVNASLTTTYGYDVAGNLTSTTLPSANGYIDTRAYDRAGRLTEVKNQKGATVLSRFVGTLDPAGNPTRIDRTGALIRTQTYTYDANDRILSACFQASCTPGAAALVSWTYDKVGNRLTEVRSTGTTNYTHNNSDQLTTAGSTSYTYDSNGNQLTAGTRTFAWGLANRLNSTTQGSTTTAYTYDGDGIRLQTSTGTVASAKTNFLWDVNGTLPQVALERNGSGTLQRQYIYGLRRIRQTVGTASYYHYDALGSSVNLTSASGATQRTWSYEPYGVIRTSTGSTPTNFMQFTGEYLDPTGLYHLRARQYDPATGRFLAVDPVEPSASQGASSAYSYVAGRPTMMVDPSGKTMRPAQPQKRVLQAASPLQSDVQPREKWKSLPRWSSLGIYYGGLFIQAPYLCPLETDLPLYPCLRGDNRGFSQFAGRNRYRLYMGFDFTAGLAYFRVNPTCELNSGKCHRPHEIEESSFWDWNVFGTDRANYIDKEKGEASVGFRWKLINSAIGLPLQGDPGNPLIDGGIDFKRSGSVDVDLDGFPSFELYRRARQGGASSCVYQFGETRPFGLFLPAFIPGMDEGKSHC